MVRDICAENHEVITGYIKLFLVQRLCAVSFSPVNFIN